MNIIKRDGREDIYNAQKILSAVNRAFLSVGTIVSEKKLNEIVKCVEEKIKNIDSIHVEKIQDLVEKTLMEKSFYDESKSYILYRESHAKKRKIVDKIITKFDNIIDLKDTLKKIQIDFSTDEYSIDYLENKFSTFIKINMNNNDKLNILIKSAVDLTTKESPDWEFIAGRLLFFKFNSEYKENIKKYKYKNFYDKIRKLVDDDLYGKYILDSYTEEEINICERYIDNNRNELFNFSGLDILIRRYLIRDKNNRPLETPQEMFLGIAMHLAMIEKKDRLKWVKKFYDMLSLFKVTMATPTMANARRSFHQLSSCFIDVVPDNLTGIYRSIDNFAQVSKFGGGMGLYFGKVRANGSSIRGFKGAAGGVIRWIKLANDTAVAVDQLGVRQGAVSVYLDVWHKDLPEFLSIRTNNGDDRMKAHDVFPGICYPDLFWKLARDEINSNWYLMCPHEIKEVKGYCLEDYWGEEWEKKYKECVEDKNISKRIISVKEIVRLIIKSSAETGTPFIFNRDIVNRLNPNNHKGIIYCSNLCTEIAQNMSEIQDIKQEVKTVDKETIVVTMTKPGDFVVCNLASLSLGKINVKDDKEIKDVVKCVVRALDNVIDLNFFPVPYAKINNLRYRPIGLGVSGYHHMLAKNYIIWESEKHLKFCDEIFEKINYATILASCELAIEKGKYEYFEGSDWQTGDYFVKRNYVSEEWINLREKVKKYGLRNGWLISVAPTSSTSIIVGTTPGIDPIMDLFFLEEKKNSLIPRVAPELSLNTQWYYKSAYTIDQIWIIRAAAIRQKHIDQSQSMNLYITNDYSFRQILNLYISAFELGIKTIYYIRSKSLEIEECTTCTS